MVIVNRLSRRVVVRPVREAMERLLADYGAEGEVVVSLCGGREVRELNLAYRGLDEPTDVLTFPAPLRFVGVLGDVVVNMDFAELQGSRRGVGAAAEAAMLAVHGGLHLLGFEDETEAGRSEMVRRQNLAMRAVGLPEDADWFSLPHDAPELGGGA